MLDFPCRPGVSYFQAWLGMKISILTATRALHNIIGIVGQNRTFLSIKYQDCRLIWDSLAPLRYTVDPKNDPNVDRSPLNSPRRCLMMTSTNGAIFLCSIRNRADKVTVSLGNNTVDLLTEYIRHILVGPWSKVWGDFCEFKIRPMLYFCDCNMACNTVFHSILFCGNSSIHKAVEVKKIQVVQVIF